MSIDDRVIENSYRSPEIGTETTVYRSWSPFDFLQPGFWTYSFAQDGYFAVTISSQADYFPAGDFYLVSSKLTARRFGSGGDSGTGSNPVPEPGALWLMSVGIAALGFVRRGRRA